MTEPYTFGVGLFHILQHKNSGGAVMGTGFRTSDSAGRCFCLIMIGILYRTFNPAIKTSVYHPVIVSNNPEKSKVAK